MRNEQMFAEDEPGAHGMPMPDDSRNRSDLGRAVDDRVAFVLRYLDSFDITPMSRDRADRTLDLLGRVQTRVASMMCDVTRTVSESDPGTDPAEVLRTRARVRRRESKRMAKVARQLTDMPKVREKFAEGDITLDQASALADAAEKVGPDVVESDPALLESADRMLPDTFDRHARKWSDEKLVELGIDLLERQRLAREANLWVEEDTGLGVVKAKLPRPQYEQVRQAVDNHYLRHLRQDGADGRDPDEVRSPQHRLADVMFALITNRSAFTGEFLTDTVGVKAKASTQVIITAEAGAIDGTNPNGRIEMIGVGPVPRQILRTLTPDTELAGMIYDRAGRVLWLGRNQRLGNAAQRLAVAVRDGGCFECGAAMHRCELHHIREWHRDNGRTDVDNLVAVCRRHHKWIETENLMVRRAADGYEAIPRDGPVG